MARITVEDCIDKFPSRFELVLVASNRARKLFTGENPTVEIDNDKNTVVALREIAEETLTIEELRNNLIEEYQVSTFGEDEEINEIEDNSEEDLSTENNENTFEEETVTKNENQIIDEPEIENLQDSSQNLTDDNKE
tara:strand:- start:664 stop:1074 length:411 start_codon:yes stop_codon:yes gene_type:complete